MNVFTGSLLIAALILLLGILRVRRRVLAEEAETREFLAELGRRKEIEMRAFARGEPGSGLRFGDLKRGSK